MLQNPYIINEKRCLPAPFYRQPSIRITLPIPFLQEHFVPLLCYILTISIPYK